MNSQQTRFKQYRTNITPDTFLRNLPYSILQNLARQLDPEGTATTWKDLALRIPRDRFDLTPRFTMTDIQHFEMRSRQWGKSPTESVLCSWSTNNATVQDLIDVFNAMNLPKLADMVLQRQKPITYLDQPPSYSSTIGFPIPISPKIQPQYRQDTQHVPKHVPYHHSESRRREPIEHDSLSSRRQPTENCVTIESVTDSLQDLIPEENLPSFSYSDLRELTSNFNDSCKLGEGAFGSVFSGHLSILHKKPVDSDPRKIAIKRLKLDGPDLAVAVAEQFKKEIHIISKLQHENILPLVGYSCDGPELCLVYDFMYNGSLSSKLKECREEAFVLSIQKRIEIAEGSTAGIEYLHKMGLIHRDIKSSNILLDMENRPRIGDFGLIRAVHSKDKTSTVTTKPIGTPMYMAPEAYRGEVSSAMDVYGFGVVLLELITSQAVHDENRDPTSLESYVTEQCDENPGVIMELVDKTAGNWNKDVVFTIYELATACLDYKRKRRPTMTKVLSILNSCAS